MVARRTCLALSIACFAQTAIAHTPYGHWDTFRQSHLLFLSTREDPEGDKRAERWVQALVQQLPHSNAMVSRTKDWKRLASIFKTDQSRLAVLSSDMASRMSAGDAPFAEFAPVPMTLLLDDGQYLLIARTNLPNEHAFVLTQALLETASMAWRKPTLTRFGIPVHPGAAAYFAQETATTPNPGQREPNAPRH